MAVETQAVRKRSEIPVEYTWDLGAVYAGDEAWEEAFRAIEARAPEIEALQGKLGQSAPALLHALQLSDEVEKSLYQLFAYARMRKDADGTDPAGQAMESRAGTLVARIAASLAFIEPEILQIPAETLATWQEQEKGLEPYAYMLDLLNRQRPHVRSSEVEAVLAQFSDVTRTTSETFDVLSNVDLTFPTIDDENGNPIQVSNARYGSLVMSKDRRVRRDAFLALHGTYQSVARTCAATLGGAVRTHVL